MSRSKPKKRTRLKPEVRRAQLLDVGLRVFAREGLDATSLDEVAVEAGVTKPVVYHYFEHKQAFFDAIAEREMEILSARITEIGAARESLHGALEQATTAFFDYLAERPDGFAALMSHTSIGWYGDNRVAELRRELYANVVLAITRLLETAEDDSTDPALASHGLIGAFIFAGQYWLGEGRDTPPKVAGAQLASTIWFGLRGNLPR